MFKGQIGVDGERGRPGAPGPPVSVHTDFYAHQTQTPGMVTPSVFMCFH